MGSRRFLFAFGIGGGLAAGLLIGLSLRAVTGQPSDLAGWATALSSSVAAFTLCAYGTWFPWAAERARRRGEVISALAGGDLSVTPTLPFDDRAELQRLIQSLRRAVVQVQRVTANVHRTCHEVTDQARSLLEAARRQAAAVDRSQRSVRGMGDSLQAAGRRVVQLEAFANDTTTALTAMTQRIDQVAGALGLLDRFAHQTSQSVQAMSDGWGHIAASGEALARFVAEAESFAADVEGGIHAVRRRAHQTGDLAHEVTATAEHGEALVGDSVRSLYRIDESVRRAAELVESLGSRSAEIHRIVDVIQEIADQTNLLALNAAIIASQAGESGHAFGVVAGEIRSLAERTARSTREVGSMIGAIGGAVASAVALVKESRAQASQGVVMGDRAALALKEIRAITQRTFSAVEGTVTQTERLEAQGTHMVEASRQVSRRVEEVTRAAVEQAARGRELVRRTQEMANLAQGASQKAEGQARTGRDLSDSVLRLTAAIDEIRSAHQVLTQGDAAIDKEVAQVREDAKRVILIADGLSRGVDQLSLEAKGLQAEAFRFKLPAPRRGGALKIGIHQSNMLEATRGLDPLFTCNLQLVEITANLYSGLLRSEDGVLLPDLAERWEADPSARRYRFYLRRNVRFHDGTPFSAPDVKRHFERLLDPNQGSPEKAILREVEGALAFMEGREEEVSGIEVLDEFTLEIRLQEPRAFFLHLVCLPSAAIARLDAAGRAVGTGPFVRVEAGAQRLVLERFGGYYRTDVPLLDRLEFLLYQSRSEALAGFLRGEVNLVSGLYAAPSAHAALGDHQVIAATTPSCWFLGFNLREEPFSDVRVRKAIRAGLDLTSMVERFHPGARLAHTLTPPELLAHSATPTRPDVALSRRLLEEAGLQKVRLSLHHAPGRGTEQEDAVLFRPLLEAGLVELTHVELGASEYWRRQREGKIPVFRAGWIADYPDPDNFLYVLLHSAVQTVYAIGYQSEELDRLTSQARGSMDPERRQQLYLQAERTAHEDCALVPLYHEQTHAVASLAVQGLRLHQIPPQVRFEALWLDRPASLP